MNSFTGISALRSGDAADEDNEDKPLHTFYSVRESAHKNSSLKKGTNCYHCYILVQQINTHVFSFYIPDGLISIKKL